MNTLILGKLLPENCLPGRQITSKETLPLRKLSPQKIVPRNISPKVNSPITTTKKKSAISFSPHTPRTNTRTNTQAHTTNRHIITWNCILGNITGSNDLEKEGRRNQTEWISLKLSLTKTIWTGLSWCCIPTWCSLIDGHLLMIVIIYSCIYFVFIWSRTKAASVLF